MKHQLMKHVPQGLILFTEFRSQKAGLALITDTALDRRAPAKFPDDWDYPGLTDFHQSLKKEG